MKAFPWKRMAGALALACTPLLTQAAPIYYTDWAPAQSVNFSVLPPPDISGRIAGYMWYCDPAIPNGSCSGTNAFPDMAEFRYAFNLPSSADFGFPLYIQNAYISVAADDYFALYVNGQLKTPNGVWHDDTGGSETTFDLTSSLILGAANEILIFACDGNPPNPRVAAGATPAGGWDGCPNPSDRVNSWLLTDGLIELVYNVPGGATVFRETLNSTGPEDLTNWEARGAFKVPEPGSAFLVLAGMGWLLVRRKGNAAAQAGHPSARVQALPGV